MLSFKKTEDSGLVPSAQKLNDQINSRWTKREQGQISIATKQESREIIINKNLNGSLRDDIWLTDQLIAYCKNKKPGSVRISIIQDSDRVASGNHTSYWWTLRNWTEDILDNIKITFAFQTEHDPMSYDIPILNADSDIWSGEVPFFDRIINSINTSSADRSVWNLSCRLKELGFVEEAVLPEGRQKYPKVGIRNLQDYMGLQRTEYNEELHRKIWGEFRISDNTP